MRWILMRHGIAIDRADPDCPSDPLRMLTDRGVHRTRLAARGLATQPYARDVQAVISSPYLRATQTAALVREALPVATRLLDPLESLVPAAPGQEALAELVDLGLECAVVCGHCPNLDDLIAVATGAPAPFTHLKKAGVAVLDFYHGSMRAQLTALLPPAVLRKLR